MMIKQVAPLYVRRKKSYDDEACRCHGLLEERTCTTDVYLTDTIGTNTSVHTRCCNVCLNERKPRLPQSAHVVSWTLYYIYVPDISCIVGYSINLLQMTIHKLCVRIMYSSPCI